MLPSLVQRMLDSRKRPCNIIPRRGRAGVLGSMFPAKFTVIFICACTLRYKSSKQNEFWTLRPLVTSIEKKKEKGKLPFGHFSLEFFLLPHVMGRKV